MRAPDPALWATLPGRLVAQAEALGDEVALREKRLGIWQEISWRGYLDNVTAVGHALSDTGVEPGDHVAILSDNRTEWLFADLGTQAIGARSVGIYQTNPPPDVAYILSHAGCKVLFCEDQEQVDKATEVASETPSVERIIVFDPRGTRAYTDSRLEHWSAFIDRGRRLAAADPDWFVGRVRRLDPDAPSMVVYTSGTTGRPKGALISSRNVTTQGDAAAELFDAAPRDQLLSYLPLCHVAEKIFSEYLALTAGSVVHFGEAIETVQEDLREVSPTIFLGVPRIWEKMYAGVSIKMQDASWLKRSLYKFWLGQGTRLAGKRLQGAMSVLDRLWWRIGDLMIFRPLQERLGMRRCRLPVSGAAPISKHLLMQFHALGIRIHEGYGMTEVGGVSHVNPPDAIRLGTVGPALSMLDCRIADDGEVLMGGPSIFKGYLHQPEATSEAIDERGWLHTGDVGAIDADGYLTITGRKKDIIITSGGKNLSPESIENALKTSTFIKEAVVFGDGRKFVSALVQIEADACGNWATRREIPFTSYADLTSNPAIVKLIQGEIDRANESLARVEQVREFRLLPKELHQDDGEMTATQKVRRSAVEAAYRGLVAAMYGEEADA